MHWVVLEPQPGFSGWTDDHASILPIINYQSLPAAAMWPGADDRDRAAVLRDWREEDIEPFIRHTNTPAVMRWLGGVQTEAAAARGDPRPGHALAGGARLHLLGRSSARRTASCSAFAGSSSPTPQGSPIEGEHEVGWRLREDAWGQGYAKEAAIASLDHRLRARSAPSGSSRSPSARTTPSWGLMERLGMTRRAGSRLSTIRVSRAQPDDRLRASRREELAAMTLIPFGGKAPRDRPRRLRRARARG